MPNYLVVDSSVLIFYDRKGELEDFLQQKRKENYCIVIPKAIVQELVDEPEEFAKEIRATAPELANKIADSVTRIKAAVEQGLVEVKAVDYRRYSKIIDNVRKYLSKLDAKPEYEVKKGDPEIVALVVQLYNEAKEKVFVATLDKGLLRALKPFRKEAEYAVLDVL